MSEEFNDEVEVYISEKEAERILLGFVLQEKLLKNQGTLFAADAFIADAEKHYTLDVKRVQSPLGEGYVLELNKTKEGEDGLQVYRP